jgi:cytochrome c oxidase assembly protein subunit 15
MSGYLRRQAWAKPFATSLAGVTAAGMFLVLLMGETVTSTGSAEGCGRDWPLCQGQLIPNFALATWIEFSHRFVTGVEGVLILALCVFIAGLWWDRRPVRVLAPLLVLSLLLQAGMGAWAVKYPQSPLVLALHFGFSLIALASAVLVAVYVRRIDEPLPAPVPASVAWATWGFAAYVYLLVYSGAYIRHAAAAAACPTWPGCSATVVAGGPEALAVDVLHRVLAGLAVVFAVGLLLLYRRGLPERGDLATGAVLAIAALLLQGAAGAYLVLSSFGVLSELAHAGVTGLVFVACAYLCLQATLDQRAERPAGMPATASPNPVT